MIDPTRELATRLRREVGLSGQVAQKIAPKLQRLISSPAWTKLADERRSISHKFWIGGHEGVLSVDMYSDGRPAEIFIRMNKEGATFSGFIDSFSAAISVGLQHGVPLKVYVDRLMNFRFEPAGYTHNPEIKFASSIVDYVARWLGGKFISRSYLKLYDYAEGPMLGTQSANSSKTPRSKKLRLARRREHRRTRSAKKSS